MPTKELKKMNEAEPEMLEPPVYETEDKPCRPPTTLISRLFREKKKIEIYLEEYRRGGYERLIASGVVHSVSEGIVNYEGYQEIYDKSGPMGTNEGTFTLLYNTEWDRIKIKADGKVVASYTNAARRR